MLPKKPDIKPYLPQITESLKAGSDPFAINRIIVKDSIAWFKKRMVVYTNTILSKPIPQDKEKMRNNPIDVLLFSAAKDREIL